jgi:hypothetical protein
MNIVYKVVGYDRKTERQAAKIDIPPKLVGFVRGIAGIAPDDESMADCPLDKNQARDIAGVIDKQIDAEKYDYFLEPYVQAPHRRSA